MSSSGGTTGSSAAAYRQPLRMVLAISAAVVVVELVVGIASGSLALLADAGHAFADVVGTSLALASIWFGSRPATGRRTFGFYRTEIFAAVFNALLLFTIAVVLLVESVQRFIDAPLVSTGPVLMASAGALLAQATCAWLLRSGQRESLTLRGAYLEVLGDALGSAAVLVSALVITFTGFRQADAVASAFIGLLILPRTVALLRDAMDVLLEATPKDVDLEDVRGHILEAPGVRSVHDLHVWTITSGRNVVSAHVLIDPQARHADVLDGLCRCLATQFDIDHSTFQLETEDRTPHEADAHR